ncbi:putative integral membrane protein [Actinacidiphila reveromycinica]|uniref:Putative integral membrane protein n=1 Tax=Actinacidiphila reveromycinica TaxID=659352 RepID=A0A7U3VLL0_9ACTN|nr:PepSY-associated TM helix domain-containing protein [Streptomyces sp. SN-593]BBA95622.1 putative integral membrane protein [Streptomyces sp. SN-593]
MAASDTALDPGTRERGAPDPAPRSTATGSGSGTRETVRGPGGRWAAVRPLLRRLHFYAGVLVGPFLLVAATTGLVYTASPQIEGIVYRHELHVAARNPAQVVPLARQVAAGEAAVPGGTLQSVDPPAGPTDTTRVLLGTPGLPDGYSRTAFVDPYTGKVRGVLTTYGQWLPVRAWLDTLHRTLHLGAFGRNYSELAASWLWVEVLGGLALWLGARRRKGERLRRTVLPRVRGGAGRRRTLSWHAVAGLGLSAGLLGLSATGLTWSDHAGASIGALQARLKGGSPSVSTVLPAADPVAHGGGRSVGIGTVVASAHRAGLGGPLVVTPPAAPGTAWTVKENTRHWPERQDSVAVDPHTGKVTARLRFADYPVLAKLTRWGIDAHMGLLFGLANQIVLALLAVGLIAVALLGYRMWWLRRPTRRDGSARLPGRAPARGAWRRVPGRVLAPALLVAAVLGYYLPLLGLPLLVFLGVDLAVGALIRRRFVTGVSR